MTPTALLEHLEQTGVTLAVTPAGNIRFRATAGRLTPELQSAMHHHKAELIRLMNNRPGQWARKASALLSTITRDERRADLRYQFEERAGIAFFDGGLSSDEAERIAYEQIQQQLKEVSP